MSMAQFVSLGPRIFSSENADLDKNLDCEGLFLSMTVSPVLVKHITTIFIFTSLPYNFHP